MLTAKQIGDALRDAVSDDDMQMLGASIEDCMQEAELGNTRLQNLICMGIPIYNVFARLQGWPVLPLPAFCSNPTPAPAASAEGE